MEPSLSVLSSLATANFDEAYKYVYNARKSGVEDAVVFAKMKHYGSFQGCFLLDQLVYLDLN